MNFHPHKFIEALIKQRGTDFYLNLCEKSKRQTKLYADDLISIASDYESRLKSV